MAPFIGFQENDTVPPPLGLVSFLLTITGAVHEFNIGVGVGALVGVDVGVGIEVGELVGVGEMLEVGVGVSVAVGVTVGFGDDPVTLFSRSILP